MATGREHRNRLADETSPYLLQHAHNPVDWWPWGEPAFAAARAEAKPIFLSIGYAACHWCHVMERESFEDEAIAAQLNRDFVAIKVDREERPEVDQLYMAAVQAMTGGGGWPMSVFLTPDGKPFYGGTYFPPEPSHGLPAFRDVLEGVRRAWDEQREEVEQAGTRLVDTLIAQQHLPAAPGGLSETVLDAAAANAETSFDARTGGWGGAPKFPQPMTIEFLLRRAVRGDERSLAVARRSLDAMAAGGIHDQLGGGFHRYSTDARWLVPHFEKMLYDNAQLARAYVHAWQLTGDRRYEEVARRTLEYVERELRTPDGAFAASQDADTEGVEGATYAWTADELRTVLGDGDDARAAIEAYGVSEAGNWEGTNVLELVGPEPSAAVRGRLLEARSGRPQPARDDKVIAAWNGLAIAAFADAARAWSASNDDERAAWARSIGERVADTIADALVDADGRVGRSWRAGRATGIGVLEDHADLAESLLALYEATYDEHWFVLARRIADRVLRDFADPAGGWFDTPADGEGLVVRPKDVGDNATPSGNARLTFVCLRFAAWTGERLYAEAAERALATVAGYLARYPTGFGEWLSAADLALHPPVEIAIVGDPDAAGTRRLLAPAVDGLRPYQVTAVGADPATTAVPLLGGRFALAGRPTAFVCRDFACRQPVTEPEALAALLAEEPAIGSRGGGE
ncbi:MAG TPA: thioredoxin domain-containing protein [Candidatus Limnocylindrales bacterium]|nr:thioredoxin domain-containing protein [Candidatus Limnocylindrales bacterium]